MVVGTRGKKRKKDPQVLSSRISSYNLKHFTGVELLV